jgi:hypothetical protein
LIYAFCGIVFGSVPEQIFRDNRSFEIFNLCTGSVLLHSGYFLLTGVFNKSWIILPWYGLVLVVLLNMLVYLLIDKIRTTWSTYDKGY